ncbi:MAG: amidohydrolase family protein [Phycisphaerales bacterium]
MRRTGCFLWTGRSGSALGVFAVVLSALAAVLCVGSGARADGGSLAIRAGRIITADASQPFVIEDGVIVVRDGRVVAVGKNVPIPPDLRVIDCPDATVMPGLVSASSSGPASNAPESMRAAYKATDAFGAYNDYRELLSAGVTTMHASPGWNRLVSGRGGVVRLGGAPSGRILRDEADLTLNLGAGAWSPPLVVKELVPPSSDNAINPPVRQRPTSRIGQFLAVKEAIEAALNPPAGAEYDANSAALARAWRDNLPMRVQAQRSADIAGAIAFFAENKRRGYVVGGEQAAALAKQFRDMNIPLVYTAPGAFQAPGRNLGNDPDEADPDVQDLAKLAGVKVAIGVGPGESAANLMLAAATAQRAGLSREQVIAGITRIPAEILGVADQVGSIAPGKRADLVILSGDPLGAGAAIQSVYVDGELAYSPAMRERREAMGEERPAAPAPPPMVVKAGTIWLGPGQWLERGEVLIEDGKISQVGKRVGVPRGARVIDAGPDSFVTPGFIDAYGHLGLEGDNSPLSAEYSLSRLVGAADVSELRVARAGVTTVMAAPYRAAGQGSQISAVKTAGVSRDRRVVAPTAGVAFDVSDADPLTIGDRFRPRIEAGKKYLETWKKYEKDLAEWEKKKAEGTLEPVKPETAEEAPAAPKVADPLTGTWRARLFGGPIPPADEREGTIQFKLTGTQFEGRLIEPPVPMEFKITGTLDGKKISGKLEIESRGLGYPTFEGTIDRDDHASGTISFQGLQVNFEMRRTDKGDVEFKIASSKRRKTTGKDGRPLPPKADESLEPMRLVLEKKIPVVVTCTSDQQIDAVLDYLVDQNDLPVVLVGAPDAKLHTKRLSEKNVSVVPPPGVLRREEHDWYNQLDDLSRSGVRVAMQSDAEDGARTLPGVALYAVRQGWSPEAALSALTIDAARAYRLESRIGSIAPGKEGDLVIFSGYPLDPGSEVKRVIVGGEEVER